MTSYNICPADSLEILKKNARSARQEEKKCCNIKSMERGMPNECLTMREPDALPDPWLMDSKYLLQRLTSLRELILRIPLTLEAYEPTNTAISAAWKLEEDLRFMLALSQEMQRDFAEKHRLPVMEVENKNDVRIKA